MAGIFLSFKVVVDAFSCHLLDALHNMTSLLLNFFVLVLQKLAQKRDRVIKYDKVSLAKCLKEVLNNKQRSISRHPLLTARLHQQAVVKADPHGIIIDTIIDFEDKWLK